MSYCVHCGVELDATASFCPLCHTPVYDPNQPIDFISPTPFPTEPKEVPPVSRRQAAVLLTTILVSVSVCCGVLNFFLHSRHNWSLYVIGAAVMVWIWAVLPLLYRRKNTFQMQLFFDVLAVAVYVSLIAVDLDGWRWYCGLALPIILLLGAVFLLWGLILGKSKRSTLTTITIVLGSIGGFAMGVEFFLDRYFHQSWSPSWSLIVLAACVVMMIPLIIVRRTPSLREEVRRRFHL